MPQSPPLRLRTQPGSRQRFEPNLYIYLRRYERIPRHLRCEHPHRRVHQCGRGVLSRVRALRTGFGHRRSGGRCRPRGRAICIHFDTRERHCIERAVFHLGRGQFRQRQGLRPDPHARHHIQSYLPRLNCCTSPRAVRQPVRTGSPPAPRCSPMPPRGRASRRMPATRPCPLPPRNRSTAFAGRPRWTFNRSFPAKICSFTTDRPWSPRATRSSSR